MSYLRYVDAGNGRLFFAATVERFGLVLIASNIPTKRVRHDSVERNMLASRLKSDLGYENAYRIDKQALGLFGIVGCEDRAKRIGSFS